MRDPTRTKPGRPGTGIVSVPIDRWAVLLHDRYPAYISWDQFMANQARLKANQNSYKRGNPGAPRRGQALLQGIAICARCGAHMQLQYSGPSGEFPVYVCFQAAKRGPDQLCQHVRALGLDEEIERILLDALAPDNLAIAVATMAEVEREDAALQRQWQLRLERARYEAERAQRQYDAVEPENRLVARSLEAQWEDKLRAVEHSNANSRVGVVGSASPSTTKIWIRSWHLRRIYHVCGLRLPRQQLIGSNCCGCSSRACC
jgi:hypothetical protein